LGTSNSALLKQGRFSEDYACLTEDAAAYLVEKGIKLVAVDYLSVDAFDTDYYPVHRRLLEGGVAVVEGDDLSGVPAGDYELICLPLKIKNGDGAPARVVLREL
jgi:arylformamidase